MIDLHCHLLPGVDDGAPDMARAVELAALSVAGGISHAVLTPHVYPGVWDNTPESLQPAFQAFRESLLAAGVPLELTLGGEVRLLPECLEQADRGALPTIGQWEGYRVLLLEFPDGQIPVGTDNAVAYLRDRGYLPMIAHPERNRAVMTDPSKIAPLLEAGCLMQLTAASVIGGFGARVQRTALQMLDAGIVTVVATDAHNVAHRPPRLAEARAFLEERYGAEPADALTRTMPAKIIGHECTIAPGVAAGDPAPEPVIR
ncbi:MAG: Tyrosine-protein phosphatase YwqE [Pseudomonadota bacterium]|jgi:protein-tyrosine phosphatase